MEKNKDNGYPVVKTEEDLKIAFNNNNKSFFYVICPRCHEGWTSTYANALSVIKTKSCLGCTDDWEATIDVYFKNNIKKQ